MSNSALNTDSIAACKEQLAANPNDTTALADLFYYYSLAGDLDNAEFYLKRIDQLEPENIEVKHNLGLICQAKGNYEEAVTWILRAIDIFPKHIMAHSNLGQLLVIMGKNQEAKYYFQKAIDINPEASEAAMAYSNLAILQTDEEAIDQAIDNFHKSLQLRPNHPPVLLNLAHALIIKKDFEAALAILENLPIENEDQKLKKNKEYIKIYSDMGKHFEALKICEATCKEFPDDAEVHSYLAKIYKELEDYDKSNMHSDKARSLAGPNSRLLLNLAMESLEEHNTSRAKQCLETLLGYEPANSTAYAMLGYICLEEGNPSGAVNCCELALSIDNTNTSALRYMGHAYQLLNDYDQAAKYFLEAMELSPGDPDALANLGALQRTSTASGMTRKILFNSIKPVIEQYNNRKNERDPIYFTSGQASALGQYVMNCAMNCLWDEVEQVKPLIHIVLKDQLAENVPLGISPFISQYALDYKYQLDIARDLGKANKAAKYLIRNNHPCYDNTKLRIAYISPDLNEHVVGFLLQHMFQYHDRDKFEIYAYSLRNSYDEVRLTIEKSVDHFIDISEMPVPDAVEQIYNDKINILVDLAGYTSGAKPSILGHQPAPIQAQFIGWAGTMGAEFIQYHINTEDLIPSDQLAKFTEQIVYLPESPIGIDQYEVPEDVPSKHDYGLPENKFVFCCFNSTYRITKPLFKAWMDILKAVPDSVLWLGYYTPTMIDHVKQHASDQGIDPDRLIFRELKILNDDWHHRLADVYLDTAVVSGGTTTMLSLWVDLPVLTVKGDSPAGMYGCGLNAALNVDELITENLEDYTQKAIQLATDKNYYQQIQNKIHDNKQTSCLFDQSRWVEQLEQAYQLMWQDHLEGHTQKVIRVPR